MYSVLNHKHFTLFKGCLFAFKLWIGVKKMSTTEQGWQFTNIMSQFGNRDLVHAMLFPHLSPAILWPPARCAQTQAGLFWFNATLCFLVYAVSDNQFFRFWLTISSNGSLSTSRESWFDGGSSNKWNALFLSFIFWTVYALFYCISSSFIEI